jgi:transcriptional regulator GlxA family with amidase domain
MLYNKIKSITGKTPGQIIKKIRIHNAEALIRKNQYSIKEVQNMTGFSNPKSFRDAFLEEFEFCLPNIQSDQNTSTTSFSYTSAAEVGLHNLSYLGSFLNA